MRLGNFSRPVNSATLVCATDRGTVRLRLPLRSDSTIGRFRLLQSTSILSCLERIVTSSRSVSPDDRLVAGPVWMGWPGASGRDPLPVRARGVHGPVRQSVGRTIGHAAARWLDLAFGDLSPMQENVPRAYRSILSLSIGPC